jgi:hypothetical protein
LLVFSISESTAFLDSEKSTIFFIRLEYLLINYKQASFNTLPNMPGGAVDLIATSDVNRIEAPVTFKAYMMCAFAAFGGIFFGYDSGYINGVLGKLFYEGPIKEAR